MAIIPKYTLNEKFENGKKPPQWDFWAWQDSYWHKDEKIPTAAVEGLDSKLQKKADLIDNMIDVNQLPFSVVTSEILKLGEVSIVGNEVVLSVHSTGANVVRVKGRTITRTFPNTFPFSPITGTGFKVLRGYAMKNEDDFFMVESAELPEQTDPQIPAEALQIFKFILSSTAQIVIPVSNGFIPLQGTEVGKPVTRDIEIFTASGDTKGLKSRVNGTPYYSYVGFDDDGSPLLEYTSFTGYSTRLNLYNNSLILGSDDPNFRGIDGIEYYGNAVGDNYFAQQKYVNDKIASITVDLTAYYTRTEVDSLLTSTYKAKGSVNNFSSLPTTGQREGDVWNTIDTGDNYVWVLNLNNTGNVGWDKLGGLVDLTAYQTTLASDSKYQLKGAYLIASDIANKLDKPTTDGSFVITRTGSVITYTSASTLGKNIGNSDLTLSSNRKLSQSTFTYTHETNGVDYKITGLLPSLTPDKALVLTADKNVKEATIVIFDEIYTGATNLTQQNLVDNYPTAKFVDAPNTTPPKVYYKRGFSWVYFTTTEIS